MWAAFAVLIVLTLFFFLLNICIGSVGIPFTEIPKLIIEGEKGDATYREILMEIRMPRAFGTVILGGALALSGYLLQTFFHNPIASPFTLGISSGAKLIVALTMVVSLGYAVQLSSWMLIMAAFAGSMLCMGFVLLTARVIDQMSMLIVSGVMIGYICSAVTDFIVTFADDANIVNLHNWSQGSFSGISWENVAVMAVVVLTTSLGVFLLSKQISAYEMGEAYAEKYGTECPGFPDDACFTIQHFVCQCDRVCGTGLFCRDCGTTSGEKLFPDGAPDSDDSGLFFGRWSILPVL